MTNICSVADGAASWRLRASRAIVALAGLFGACWVAAMPSTAQAAMPNCNAQALGAIVPAGVTLKEIPNLAPLPGLPKTVNGVGYAPATSVSGKASAEFCMITGTIITNPKTGKTANFAAVLPSEANWNRKFLFQGCGYNCGFIFPSSFSAVERGYTVWATDDGHIGTETPTKRISPATSAAWATRSPGAPNVDTIEDFYHRAVRTVTMSGKRLVRSLYKADKIDFSYLIGCSDGGREGMVAASFYPEEFNGIIAGAPFFDMRNEIMTSYVGVLAQLRSPGAAISPAQFKLLGDIAGALCDKEDGVADGLVQNPAQCRFNPNRDLPQCKPGQAGDKCFTKDQIDSVNVMLSSIVSPSGKVVFPGFSFTDAGRNLALWLQFEAPASNIAGPYPWAANPKDQPLGWFWASEALRHFVYHDAPGFDPVKTAGITFRRNKAGYLQAVIPDATAALVAERVRAGSGATPEALAKFLAQGRKLIMYHGYSDGLITPYRTVQYFRDLARLNGGYEKLGEGARLFMLPNVDHCFLGTGPDNIGQIRKFGDAHPLDARNDVLVALEQWVEHGNAPEALIATKYREADNAVERTMPLCPFPAMAKYNGVGDVNKAESWSCQPGDRRLETKGYAGLAVGNFAPIDTGR